MLFFERAAADTDQPPPSNIKKASKNVGIRNNKKGVSNRTPLSYVSDCGQSALLLTHAGEALAAVHRTVRLGLERHTGLATAHGASSGEILTGTASGVLAGVAAGLAALGLILEAALGIEFLLAGGEYELFSAFLAHKSLVFKHFFTLSF